MSCKCRCARYRVGGPGEPSLSPSRGGLGNKPHNFKNAGDYYLTRTGVKMLVVTFLVLGYSTRVSDATLADVLLVGMVLLSFGAGRRWGRFRGEENFNKRVWFSRTRRFFKGF